jgi:hypothetical protein
LPAGRSSGADASVDFVFEFFGVFLDDAEAAFDGVVGGSCYGLMRAEVTADGSEGGNTFAVVGGDCAVVELEIGQRSVLGTEL